MFWSMMMEDLVLFMQYRPYLRDSLLCSDWNKDLGKYQSEKNPMYLIIIKLKKHCIKNNHHQKWNYIIMFVGWIEPIGCILNIHDLLLNKLSTVDYKC